MQASLPLSIVYCKLPIKKESPLKNQGAFFWKSSTNKLRLRQKQLHKQCMQKGRLYLHITTLKIGLYCIRKSR
jgi:hypothetical protein